MAESMEIREPREVLREHWGYPEFRPLQEDIIRSVLAGHDTLALMPTGGGKSICFQVPALCQKGICLVVSPLIALMKDQVHQLQQHHIPAAAIFSGMDYRDIDRVLDNCIYGQTKLLYLSPERLATELARERISRMHVNLLAVDEAHCISQWGYDFRPAYLQIAAIRELLPKTPVLALTATAIPAVVDDIQEQLNFPEKRLYFQSFVRENLAYVVLREEAKLEKLLDILRKVPGSAIVYVRNRRMTKEVAYWLRSRKVSAAHYHGGLDHEERSQLQEAWIDGKVRVMVSTNAFGMGIDKPDVRSVVHLDLPDSLEAYYQEAGRAGRDGRKAYATLLYDASDRLRLETQYDRSFPDVKEIRRIYQALGSYYQLAIGSGEGQSFDFDLLEFSRTFKLEPIKAFSALKVLEQAGWVVLTEAVHVPSSFQILVDKDTLYDYQLKNRQFDKVLKALLRTHAGSFQNQVAVRERQLARFLKMPVEDLLKALRQFHQDRILDFRPAKDRPQLIFLWARVDARHLTIDRERYEFRKKRQLERIQLAIEYAERLECRSRQLAAYFGETDTNPCGKCDVCLGRHQAELSAGDFAEWETRLKPLLQQSGGVDQEQLLASFPAKEKEQVVRILEYWVQEGQVEVQGGRWAWV